MGFDHWLDLALSGGNNLLSLTSLPPPLVCDVMRCDGYSIGRLEVFRKYGIFFLLFFLLSLY